MTLPLALVDDARRVALQALLDRRTASDRLDAAFAVPQLPSRWNDGSFGALYTAKAAATALREKLHHDGRYLRTHGVAAHQHAIELLHVDVSGAFDDVRQLVAGSPVLADPDDYRAPQRLARERAAAGARGLVYASIRDAGGTCAVVFSRAAVARPRVHKSVAVEWDGQQFLLSA